MSLCNGASMRRVWNAVQHEPHTSAYHVCSAQAFCSPLKKVFPSSNLKYAPLLICLLSHQYLLLWILAEYFCPLTRGNLPPDMEELPEQTPMTPVYLYPSFLCANKTCEIFFTTFYIGSAFWFTFGI